MPTSGDPVTANDHGDQIVELQSHDCRATNGRLAEDSRAILTPAKMLRPSLATRIEQRHQAPRDWVATLGLSSLGVVAQPAREPQVFFLVSAPAGRRLKMVNFQLAQHQMLGTEAIAATLPGRLPNSVTEVNRNICARHGCTGSRSPRRTASRNASALRTNPS